MRPLRATRCAHGALTERSQNKRFLALKPFEMARLAAFLNKMQTSCLIVTTMVLTIVTLTHANPVSTPVDDPVYDFLDRMETRGLTDNLLDGVKPLSRSEIGEFLLEIDAQHDRLTAIDRDVLANFLADYRFEIYPEQENPRLAEGKTWYSPLSSYGQFKEDFFRFFRHDSPEEENHTFLWEDGDHSFYLDLMLEYTYSRRDADHIRWRRNQLFRTRGTIGQNFGYAAALNLIAIWGDRGYNELDPLLKGAYSKYEGDALYSDRSSSEIAYQSPFLTFRFAQFPLTMGHGESGQLLLSDNVEQYPYLMLQKRWKRAVFSFVHGQLLAEETGLTDEGQRDIPAKWIAAHRLEFSPLKRMSLSLNEMIVYGNRGVEWGYMLPYIVYRPVEHKLRDRDNAFIALDAEMRLMNGVKLYGTFLLDELSTSKFGTDWYGNKHGFQAGLHLTDPFGVPNLSLRLEYVALMPWIYTHKYKVNRFVYDGRSLGYWAGPNSEILYGHLQKRWHHRLNSGLTVMRWKHGANYPNENIGGDILIGHNTLLGDQTEARLTRDFLEGMLRTETRISGYITYEILNDFLLKAAFSHHKIEEEGQTDEFTDVQFSIGMDY